MKKIIISSALAALCIIAFGCASIKRLEATADAIHEGLVAGLSSSNHFDAIPWSFPGKPLGPYTKLGGLTASVTDGPDSGRTYVFFLGKSRETKDWEVFSSMKWQDGKWELVPVTLPQAPRKK